MGISPLLQNGRRPLLWLLIALSVLLPGMFAASAHAKDPSPHVMQFRLEGIIDNTAAGYVERALKRAEVEDATLVIMTLDTPGGLDGAMRRIVQALLNSKVPTAVYVSPSGARAASAGVFIVAAANVAAMAPGANLGAAHPVSSGGELPPTLSEKATNDASALIRGIASQRNRNAQWLEDAVRRSVAATAQEALELGVIDIVATSQADLLAQINGRTVDAPQGTVVLQTRGLEVRVFQMNWPERLLRVLVNPNLAFVLLALGVLGILVEFVAPGHVVPGVVGALLLLLGFLALGSLPVNWAGVVLLALGIALLVVEAFTPGFGAFGLAGIAAFVVGAFFMFTPFTPTAPSLP
ncbi:MAG: nodulation protein NfeD, partial [Chloroflexota bacterium]|nr:nodulation protein NfeD [Chloroflexota bacterium]